MTIALLSRRRLLSLAPAAGLAGWTMLAGCTPQTSEAPAKPEATPDPIAGRLAALEREAGGRLGVLFLDSANGRSAGHRSDERFALCSTVKWPLAAVVLDAVDAGGLSLDQRIRFDKSDLLSNSPRTRENLARGSMSVAELLEAAITVSDNAAANLLLPLVGGPEGVTRQFRAWGDAVTRLDRREPMLNRVGEGEVRDTTTPAAMAALLRTLLLGDALSDASRKRLIDWGAATTTGPRRLRAGLPASWVLAHKTGTAMAPGMMNKYNDIAIAYPPRGAPLLIAAYYEGPVAIEAVRGEDEAVLAAVGKLAAEWASGA
ncbi:class A beta-lactamase [Sphingopyxis sp. 113P3]|uniref:class A beta-lactamase n=1 Tax=Sphingopyxis sp. (strain 113P3) TaxID=292913 RepID=UPI0006AD32AD|nr:class A beta-lactamase [Sphingopyxis sp. 113P3]ALC11728.1 hypothetical protein LH20_07160 [Sphingopyxis sp. 113P3]